MEALQPKKLEYSKISEHIKTSAIIVSAGDSVRMGGLDKQLLPLLGIPVVARTMMKFQAAPEISEIILVTKQEHIADIQKLADKYEISKLRAIVPGGESRVISVKNGVEAAAKDTCCFAIHDGARPLVSREIISAAVKTAWDKGAAAPAVALKDTVKTVDGDKITGTLQRMGVMAVQTPQTFDADFYKQAIKAVFEDENNVISNITDDCGLFEYIGKTVYIIPGEYENIKITTPEDLVLAEAILRAENEDFY